MKGEFNKDLGLVEYQYTYQFLLSPCLVESLVDFTDTIWRQVPIGREVQSALTDSHRRNMRDIAFDNHDAGITSFL